MRGHVLLNAALAAVLAAVLGACDTAPARDADSDDTAAEDASLAATHAAPTDAGRADASVADSGRVTDRAPFPDAGPTPYRCEIGISDARGDWAPLAPGGGIPIGGSGQAGLTAQLALRVSDLDPAEAALSAVIQLVLENVATGVTADSSPWELAVNFECAGAGSCDRAPVLVEVSHLAKLPELEGTEVDVRARVLDEVDPSAVFCQASRRGVLQRR